MVTTTDLILLLMMLLEKSDETKSITITIKK